jgi:hypothetical protein
VSTLNSYDSLSGVLTGGSGGRNHSVVVEPEFNREYTASYRAPYVAIGALTSSPFHSLEAVDEIESTLGPLFAQRPELKAAFKGEPSLQPHFQNLARRSSFSPPVNSSPDPRARRSGKSTD